MNLFSRQILISALSIAVITISLVACKEPGKYNLKGIAIGDTWSNGKSFINETLGGYNGNIVAHTLKDNTIYRVSFFPKTIFKSDKYPKGKKHQSLEQFRLETTRLRKGLENRFNVKMIPVEYSKIYTDIINDSYEYFNAKRGEFCYQAVDNSIVIELQVFESASEKEEFDFIVLVQDQDLFERYQYENDQLDY